MPYHINPATGNANKCNAIYSRCPFGGQDEHYATKKEAQGAYEEAMQAASIAQPQKKEPAKEIDDLKEYYDMPSDRLQDAIARIEKANKKAENAGIDDRFGYRVEEYDVTSQEDGFTKIEKRVKLTLDRPVLQHQGWTFAGTMTWDSEAGLITRMVPGEELVERPEGEKCDVCETTRHRNDTYIIQRGGEQKQVGSACIERFMGIKPAGLWMMQFDMDIDTQPEVVLRGSDRWRDQRRDSTEMLALGLAVVESNGWVSRSSAYDSGGEKTATADIVEEVLMSNPKTPEQAQARRALIEKAQTLQAEAAEVLKSVSSLDGDNEYVTNLKALASSETVTMRNVPLLLSAIAANRRQKAKAIEDEVKAESKWVGAVGDKLDSREVTVESVKPVYSQYGTSQLIEMVDADGNRYKTFYGGSSDIPAAGTTTILASSKVKKHEEYRGAKETLITTAKFQTPRPSTLPPSALPATSPYTAAWTVEENLEIFKTDRKAAKAAMKKRAGRGNWDNAFDRPTDPELAEEWITAESTRRQEFDARYYELSGEN